VRRVVVAGAVALGVAGVVALAIARGRLPGPPRGLDQERAASGDPAVPRVVPESVRVGVEVFNASGATGVARLATLHLRDAGFDVVQYASTPLRADRSRVVVRRGAAAWGDSAARVLGGATVEVTPDTSRYVDLSVFIGRDWRPPPGPLRP
jgi:hypothetical protein